MRLRVVCLAFAFVASSVAATPISIAADACNMKARKPAGGGVEFTCAGACELGSNCSLKDWTLPSGAHYKECDCGDYITDAPCGAVVDQQPSGSWTVDCYGPEACPLSPTCISSIPITGTWVALCKCANY
ncbi:MAG: hypothetical protein IT453_01330 [Planctomycetes bacterium]|nr:hypothetical protein [Planctomycetota bacterium]